MIAKHDGFDILTVRDLSERWNRSPTWIGTIIRRGDLGAVKLSSGYVVSPDDAINFERRHQWQRWRDLRKE